MRKRNRGEKFFVILLIGLLMMNLVAGSFTTKAADTAGRAVRDSVQDSEGVAAAKSDISAKSESGSEIVAGSGSARSQTAKATGAEGSGGARSQTAKAAGAEGSGGGQKTPTARTAAPSEQNKESSDTGASEGGSVFGVLETSEEKACAPVLLEFENDELKISVEEKDAGAIPAGATLVVTPIVKKEITEGMTERIAEGITEEMTERIAEGTTEEMTEGIAEGTTEEMTEEEIAEAEALEKKYEETRQKLNERAEEEAYDIAGFLAYDIKLVDAGGNKLEPNGKVKVSMSYKKEPVLAADAQETVANDENLESTADLNVTIMHLEEDEEGNVTEVVDLSKVVPEGKTEEQAENKIEKIETDENNAVSEMVFETGGFSTFTITWKYDRIATLTVTVHYGYIDKNGVYKEDITGKQTSNLTIGDNQAIGTNQTIDLSQYVDTKVGKYENPVIYRDSYNSGKKITHLVTSTDLWGGYIKTKNGINSSAEDWLSSVITKTKTGDIYIVYSEPASGLYIDDKLISDGIFEARPENLTGIDSYVWYKSDDGNTWTKVETKTYISGDSNISADGKSLYPAFDDGSNKYYKVEALDANGNSIAVSDSVKVPYYNELRNGSFETPGQKGHYYGFWTNDEYVKQGGVWKSTGKGEEEGWLNNQNVSGKHENHIEILNTDNDPNGLKSAYKWHGKVEAADGVQLAELNASGAGALYQDVLTIPGQPMSYWFNHRARGTDSNKTEYDTMYLVIAPLEVTKDITTQEQLDNYIKSLGITLDSKIATSEGSTIIYNKDGVLVHKVSSDDLNWHYISEAGTFSPTSSVTRFFFMSGKTASGSNTVGNFIDDVGFSMGLPPVQDGEFTFTVNKKIEGLDGNDYDTLRSKLQFEVTIKDGNTDVTTKVLGGNSSPYVINAIDMNSDLNGDLSYAFANKKIDLNKTYTITVTEKNADVAGYVKTSTVVSETGVETEATETTTTVKSKDKKDISFKNVYSRTESKKVNFEKVWDDKDNACNTRPTSLDVTLKASVTYTDNTGASVTEDLLGSTPKIKVANTTKTITGPDWSCSWDVPVYYTVNGQDVKIDYTVVEGDINSDYEYEKGDLVKGSSTGYQKSAFSKLEKDTGYLDKSKSLAAAAYSRIMGGLNALAAVSNNVSDVPSPAAETSADLGEPAHRKYIDKNGEDDYTLHLNVTGKKGDVDGVDVLFIIDTSGSMSGSNGYLAQIKNILNGTTSTGNTGMVDKILNANSKNRVAYVSFAGTNEIKTQSWTTDKTGFKNSVRTLNATGGTNWTAAMKQAATVIGSANASSDKVVIFLSDGNPTYTLNSSGRQTGDGNTTYDSYYDDAAAQVNNSKLKDAFFYNVYLTNGAKTGMQKFNNRISGASLVDGTSLNTAMDQILSKIIPVYKNVTITDTLSDYVEFKDSSPKITVTKNGTVLDSSKYTASVSGKTVTVTLRDTPTGQDAGTLEDGATYEIQFDVKPSQKAIDEYSATGYPVKGDADTGVTSAGKDGFYSNDNSKTTLKYEVVGSTDGLQTASYPKPVVQVANHILTYEKIWNKPETVAKQNVTLNVTYTDGSKGTITIPANDADGIVTETVPASKKIQKIEETPITDFSPSYAISADGMKGTVTNSYSKITTNTIKVIKEWKGNGPKEDIKVSLLQSTDGGSAVVYETQSLNEGNSWTYTWKNLPATTAVGTTTVSCSYSVREENIPAGYTGGIEYSQENGITVAKVVNTYDPNCADEDYYIVNKLKTQEIELDKYWVDAEPVANHPDVTFKITRGTQKLSFELKEGNGFHKDVILPKLKNVSSYTFDEVKVDGYDTVCTFNKNNENHIYASAVNTMKTTSLTVKKIWNDGLSDRSGITVKFLIKDGNSTIQEVNLNQTDYPNWEYTLGNLPVKDHNYSVEEEGVYVYDKDKNALVKIDTYRLTGESMDDTTKTYTFTNTLKWFVKKVSKPWGDQPSVALSGAEFQLKKGTELIATGTSKTGGIVEWKAEKRAVDGESVDYDLLALDGTYTLIETKAPNGYSLSGPWDMVFDKGVLGSVNYQGTTDTVAVSASAEKGAVVEIEDPELYSLPSTGGIGIYLTTLLGVLLMLFALLLEDRRRVRERAMKRKLRERAARRLH